jgi:CBS domain-containing protein
MKNILVKDNMTKNVKTVPWSEDLQSAYDKMKKAEIRHLVVTDEYGYLRGLISDRDFQRAMHLNNDLQFREEGKTGFDSSDIVRDYMSWPAETVSTYTKLAEVAQIMINKKVSALVITDDELDATGIITHEDLLKVLIELLKENTPIKDRVKEAFYKTPVGDMVNLLKDIGI